MPKTIDDTTYYTIKDTAAYFGVSQNTIRNYLAAGKLKGYKFGHPILIKETDVKSMIKGYNPAQ